MTLPTAYKFEIAFNAGVGTPAASRTWTDVTQWVLLDPGVDIDYGRADWRGAADANSVRLTLNNSDGRFTAGLASSPYFPNVKIGRPIRVTATLGTASTRLVGFIDEWPVEWPATVGTFATATISATSRLAWLGNGVELKSIIEEEVLLDSPSAYYTLGEPAGSVAANDSSRNNAPRLAMVGTGTAVAFGSATGPGTDGLTAAQINAGKYLLGPISPAVPNTGLTVLCALSVTSAPSDTAPLVTMPCDTNGGGLWIAPSTANTLNLGGWRAPSGGPLAVVGVSGSYTVGQTTVVAVAINADGTVVSTYQDGALLGTGTWSPLIPNSTFSSLWVGNIKTLATSSTLVQPNAVIAHLAVVPSELDATHVAAISNSMLTGFAGETPAARLTRYASYAGIAAAELSLETGMVPDLAHIDITGKTAVDCMRIVEATEEGVLFDAQDGTLTFHARNHRYSAASAFTLAVPVGQVDVGISPRLDRSAMRNDVSAQSTDGKASARAINQASISDYGPQRESLDLATTNAEEPFQHASWIVGQYGTPRPRVPQLGVKLSNVPTATAQAILAAGIGTRFTVTGMPTQAQSSSQDYYVEGYSERIGPGYHDFTFNVSQADPFDVWTVEDPVLGQYDAYPIAF